MRRKLVILLIAYNYASGLKYVAILDRSRLRGLFIHSFIQRTRAAPLFDNLTEALRTVLRHLLRPRVLATVVIEHASLTSSVHERVR